MKKLFTSLIGLVSSFGIASNAIARPPYYDFTIPPTPNPGQSGCVDSFDINNDGKLTWHDIWEFFKLISAGCCDSTVSQYDFNGDGVVDGADLGLMIGYMESNYGCTYDNGSYTTLNLLSDSGLLIPPENYAPYSPASPGLTSPFSIPIYLSPNDHGPEYTRFHDYAPFEGIDFKYTPPDWWTDPSVPSGVWPGVTHKRETKRYRQRDGTWKYYDTWVPINPWQFPPPQEPQQLGQSNATNFFIPFPVDNSKIYDIRPDGMGGFNNLGAMIYRIDPDDVLGEWEWNPNGPSSYDELLNWTDNPSPSQWGFPPNENGDLEWMYWTINDYILMGGAWYPLEYISFKTGTGNEPLQYIEYVGNINYQTANIPKFYMFPDLNGDSLVDSQDMGILLGNWGNVDNMEDRYCDFNRDGIVDSQDLGKLLGDWGKYLVWSGPNWDIISPANGSTIRVIVNGGSHPNGSNITYIDMDNDSTLDNYEPSWDQRVVLDRRFWIDFLVAISDPATLP